MKTPAPNNSLSARLHATSAPPDPRRLELLERVLSGGREMPGQVLAIFHSDCGLARAYWQELMTAKANAWIGLNEALVARSREELRRWAAGVARDLASRPPEPAVQLAATEQQRVHSLRRALVADHLFATGWERFDPGTDTERSVLGVRSVFDRYLLLLRDRIFFTNLGVLAYSGWFRGPVEAVEGLDLDGLREALEQRWEATVHYFPAMTEPESAWTAAHRQAGELFPSHAAIDRQILATMRRAGLVTKPTKPLQGARA